jgi:hypothetical protein
VAAAAMRFALSTVPQQCRNHLSMRARLDLCFRTHSLTANALRGRCCRKKLVHWSEKARFETADTSAVLT